MIEINSYGGLYRQVLYSTKVFIKDFFVASVYCSYKGENMPFLFKCKKRFTSIINLSKTEEEILGAMKSNYRNEIRKAEPQGVKFELSDDKEEFVKNYNVFARARAGLTPISIKSINKYPEILISNSNYKGCKIVSHVTLLDKEQRVAILLYSTSVRLSDEADKKIVGYANKYLHYKDLCYLKSKGYAFYDFAGLCIDPNDSERYGIGLFKKGFGGEIIEDLMLYSPIMSLLLLIKQKLSR